MDLVEYWNMKFTTYHGLKRVLKHGIYHTCFHLIPKLQKQLILYGENWHPSCAQLTTDLWNPAHVCLGHFVLKCPSADSNCYSEFLNHQTQKRLYTSTLFDKFLGLNQTPCWWDQDFWSVNCGSQHSWVKTELEIMGMSFEKNMDIISAQHFKIWLFKMLW
jgi:hypothetical protein